MAERLELIKVVGTILANPAIIKDHMKLEVTERKTGEVSGTFRFTGPALTLLATMGVTFDEQTTLERKDAARMGGADGGEESGKESGKAGIVGPGGKSVAGSPGTRRR